MVPDQGKREGGFMVNLVSMFFMSSDMERGFVPRVNKVSYFY